MQKLNEITVGGDAHIDPLKENKGITLIALIITIIVMLILVGVTINVALNGGLFDKADEVADLTTTEAEKEALSMAAIAVWDVKDGVNFEAMQLPDEFTGSDGTYTSTKSKKTYKVDKATAKVTEGELSEKYFPYSKGYEFEAGGTSIVIYYLKNDIFVCKMNGEIQFVGKYLRDKNILIENSLGTSATFSENFASYSDGEIEAIKNDNNEFVYEYNYSEENQIYTNAFYKSEEEEFLIVTTTNSIYGRDFEYLFSEFSENGISVTNKGKEINYNGNVYTLVEENEVK